MIINWPELEQHVDELSTQIYPSPEIIAAVIRGGLVPARLLAQRLGVSDMYGLTVRKLGENRRVMNTIDEDIMGYNILLVEDALETGRSLIAGRDYLEAQGARVKTAALFIAQHTLIVPTFYLEVVGQIPTFPWD